MACYWWFIEVFTGNSLKGVEGLTTPNWNVPCPISHEKLPKGSRRLSHIAIANGLPDPDEKLPKGSRRVQAQNRTLSFLM